MKRKLLSIIGTRPQIFKVVPDSDVIVNTGQHYDDALSTQHFKEMKFKPKYNLGIHSENFGEMIDKLREVLKKEKPDIGLVYGDTYSTLAGALAFALEKVDFGHVEAGLRSFDKSMPEEVVRITTDRLATWKFCPTHLAVQNLMNEGMADNTYHIGDPLYWSLSKFLPLKIKKGKEYIFATIHREENMEKDKLKEIIKGLGLTGRPVYFPAHPRTRRLIKKYRIKLPANVEMVKPQKRKVTLEKIFNSWMVITDSGGIQREAYWLGKHSLIIRNTTEWMNIIAKGWATLVPPIAERIQKATVYYKHKEVPELPSDHNPYKEIMENLV